MYVGGTSPCRLRSRHPKIIALAKQIVADKENAWQQVEAIYDWVMTNIQANKGELKGAARTLLEKTGDPGGHRLGCSSALAVAEQDSGPHGVGAAARLSGVLGTCSTTTITATGFPCQTDGSRGMFARDQSKPARSC